MKARIPNLFAPKMLLYAIDPQSEKGKALTAVCGEANIPLIWARGEDMAQSLGFLAGLPGFAASETAWDKPVPQSEALIFCAMEEKMVRLLLTILSQRQIDVRLKAMMTPHNQKWALGDLMAELEEEHRAMSKA